MMRASVKYLVPLLLMFVVTVPAWAWNDKGHMVVARLTWRNLSETERAKAIEILRRHPHYGEYLSADRPEGYSEDEWVFMRAASWADWVREHHKGEYHHGTWHYINYPFVPPGSDIDPKDHQPPADEENVVNQLAVCIAKIKKGSEADRAIYMCWLFHLVGDIHQPLHTTAMFSKQFPDGDQGGNLALVHIAGKTKLHFFWDGLLGKEVSVSSISSSVKEIEDMLKDDPKLIKEDLEANKTFEAWGKESFALARKAAYLNGDLKVANETDKPKDEDIPQAPEDYGKNSGRTARIQIGKAGQRLAEQVRSVLPER